MVTGVGVTSNDGSAGGAVPEGSAEVRGCTWDDVESALRRGWQVFPVWGVRGAEGRTGVCACPKGAACNEPGKHPAVAGGLNSALGADSAFAVAAWWAEAGEPRNLGVRTGAVSDLLVVDVDVRSDGASSFDAWEEWTGLGAWPGGGRVHTGRGGVESVGAGGHWYLRWNPEWLRLERKVQSRARVLPGIDVRADGGYVLGVGSAHVAGGRYQWLPGWGGRELPTAGEDFMSWLRDLRTAGTRTFTPSGSGERGRMTGVTVAGYSFKETRRAGRVDAGGRDAYFNDLAFRLRVARYTWDKAEAEIRQEWDRTEQPPGDVYEWETALGKLRRVWATIPEGGFLVESHSVAEVMGKAAPWTPPPAPVAVAAPVAPVMSPVMPVSPTPQMTVAEPEVLIPTAESFTAAVLAGGPRVGSELDGITGAGGGGTGVGGRVMEGEILSGDNGGEETHDTGNGLRFVRLFQGKARYVRELTTWFVWDDGHWRADKMGQALEWTKEVVADIRSEAEMSRMSGDNESAAIWYKWAHATASVAKRENMLRSAGVEKEIRTDTEELDSDPWLMALRGGKTIELKTGEIRESDPGDLITKCAGVSWDDVREAQRRLERGWVGGLWDNHILRMVRGDREAAGWLRRMAGYCLTGSVREQVTVFNHADGENGKSLFMETLLKVWGDYGVKGQAGLLTAADDEHPVGLYGLRGARLVYVDEVGRARINETRLKDLTGGEIMRARDIGQSWVEFPMRGKVWVNANNLPTIRDSSHGMWRRVRVAEMRGMVGKDGWEREIGFVERVQEECLGEVLAWALDGLVEWQATGLGTYPDMEAVSAQYRSEEDMFGLFVKELLIVDVDGVGDHPTSWPGWSDQRQLYSRYQIWCALSQDRRDRVLNYSHFGRELRKSLPGVKTERTREEGERVQKVYGVRLKSVE